MNTHPTSGCMLFALLTALLLAGCTSPLDINTPRERSVHETTSGIDTTRISLVLVLDVSGSMVGTGMNGMKSAVSRLIDSLDGTHDEAALITFNQTVTVNLPMTHSRDTLHSVAGTFFASGASALWDAIWIGVQHAITEGVQPRRGVLVITDGDDNSSTHTPNEIMQLAQQSRISLSFISFGSDTQGMPAFRTMARLTGGRADESPPAVVSDAMLRNFLHTIRGLP